MNTELQRLITALLDRTATADDYEALAALLRSDPGLRAEYVRQMRVDALLRFTAGGVVAAKPHFEEVSPSLSLWARCAVASLPLGAAAAIALMWPGMRQPAEPRDLLEPARIAQLMIESQLTPSP